MTSLPDWLVERAALDEVGLASRERIARTAPQELADRVAALHADSAAELAHHPAGPAVAQIEARAAAARRADTRRRRRSYLAAATSAAAAVVVVGLAIHRPSAAPAPGRSAELEDGRAKGGPRAPKLLAFRQVGAQAEQLAPDAIVRAGDVIQLQFSAGGQRYGVIASLDGAGVVTLHYPLSEDAPPQATAVPPQATLPRAYALDDAPRFERFFIITANGPLDVQQTLAALRSLGQRDDSDTAALELPAGLRQSSLRLRKPDRTSNHESP